MSKFKVGDRVLAVDNVGMYKTPAPGTVISVYSKFSHPYRVHFDGSGYKLWSNVAGLLREKHPVIVITTDGKTTTATKRLGKQVLGTATARCNPGDKFDFDTGATLAFARLVGAEVRFAEEEKPKEDSLPEKLVCVWTSTEDWTAGKVYATRPATNQVTDNSGRFNWYLSPKMVGGYYVDSCPNAHDAQFIPLVED